MDDVIHLCDWSSHNSLHIACDDSWTTPIWDEAGQVKAPLPANVYLSDDRRLYTFADENATCPKCKAGVGSPRPPSAQDPSLPE